MDVFGVLPLNQQNPDIVPTISYNTVKMLKQRGVRASRMLSPVLHPEKYDIMLQTKQNMQALNGEFTNTSVWHQASHIL